MIDMVSSWRPPADHDAARRERPCRRTAEQRDEVAPFQLIEFPRFNISGSLAMFDATRLASSIVICFASMASASVERP